MRPETYRWLVEKGFTMMDADFDKPHSVTFNYKNAIKPPGFTEMDLVNDEQFFLDHMRYYADEAVAEKYPDPEQFTGNFGTGQWAWQNTDLILVGYYQSITNADIWLRVYMYEATIEYSSDYETGKYPDPIYFERVIISGKDPADGSETAYFREGDELKEFKEIFAADKKARLKLGKREGLVGI